MALRVAGGLAQIHLERLEYGEGRACPGRRQAAGVWETYWSELPFSSPGDLPDLGIKLASSTSPALAAGFFTTSATLEAP